MRELIDLKLRVEFSWEGRQIPQEKIFIILGISLLFNTEFIFSVLREYISTAQISLTNTSILLGKIAQIQRIEEIEGELKQKIYGKLIYYSLSNKLGNIGSYVAERSELVRMPVVYVRKIIKWGHLELCEKLINKCYVTNSNLSKGKDIFRKVAINQEMIGKEWIILDRNKILELIMECGSGVRDVKIEEYIEELNIELSEQLICKLIKGRRIELIYKLVEGRGSDIILREKSFKVAIKYEEWDYILWNIHKLKIFHLIDDTKGQKLTQALIESFQKSTNLEVKLFICKATLSYLTYTQALTLMEIFTHRFGNMNINIEGNIRKSVLDSLYLFHSYNPFKICILLIELMRLIYKKYSNIGHMVNILEQRLIYIGLEYEKLIEDDLQYREIILDKDLNGVEIIKIIQELNLHVFLCNGMAQKVTKSFWESDYNVTGSTLCTSVSYKLLFHYPFSLKFDYEKELRWKHHISNIQPHFLQFHVWMRSMKARFLISALLFLLICILFQYFKSYIVDKLIIQFDRGSQGFLLYVASEEKLMLEMETNPDLKLKYETINYVPGDPESEKKKWTLSKNILSPLRLKFKLYIMISNC